MKRLAANALCALVAAAPVQAAAPAAARVLNAPSGVTVVAPALGSLSFLGITSGFSTGPVGLAAADRAISTVTPLTPPSPLGRGEGVLRSSPRLRAAASRALASPLFSAPLPPAAEASRALGDELQRRLSGGDDVAVSGREGPAPALGRGAFLSAYGGRPWAYGRPASFTGGGGFEPPPSPPASPSGPEKPGGFKKLFRLLPDPARNALLWVYLLGSALSSLGEQFHMVALPRLAGDRIGMLRTAHWTVNAGSSFLTGPWIDRLPNRKVILANGFALSAVIAAIPALHLLGLGWGAGTIVSLFVVRSFLQVFGGNAEQVAFAKIMGRDEQAYNKINAAGILLSGVVGIAGSYLAGYVIDGGAKAYGAAAGVAAAYAAYAAFGLIAKLVFLKYLRSPDLEKPAKEGSAPGSLREAFRERLAEYWHGFKIVFVEKRFIGLSLLLATTEIFARDALTYLVLPKRIEALGGGASGFGALMAAYALSSTVAALGMLFVDGGGEKDGGARLERQGRLSYLLAAAGTLLFIGVDRAASVRTATLFYFAFNLLLFPCSIIWPGLVRKAIGDDQKDMGKAYSFISFYVPLCQGLGTLFFGWLLAGPRLLFGLVQLPHLSVDAAMRLFTWLMLADGVSLLLGAWLLFPIDRGRPAPVPPAKVPEPLKTAAVGPLLDPEWA